jgi:hypothetical protein
MAFEDISSNDVLLVTGDASDNPFGLLVRLLAAKSDGAIIITLDKGVEEVIAECLENLGEIPTAEMVIIDCSEEEYEQELPVEISVISVESPSNMTRIGIEFTNAFGSMHDDTNIDQIGVRFQSIAELIQETDIKPAYQFVQVLTGQIRTADAFGVAVLESDDSGASDDYRMLYHHFDGVLHFRQSADGSSEYQKRGLAPQWSEWKPI